MFSQEIVKYATAIARKIVGHNHAEDVAQDALIAAFQKQDQYRYESQLTTWLYPIVTNIGLDFLRKGKRKKRYAPMVPLDLKLQCPLPTPDHTMFHKQINDLVDKLPPKQQKVTRMMMAGHTETQIAQELGISVGTVKSQAFHARKTLAKALM